MARAYRRGKRIWLEYRDAAGRPVRESAPDEVKTLSAGNAEAQRLQYQQWEIKKGIARPAFAPILFKDLSARYLEVQAPTLRSFTTIKQRIERHIVPVLGSRLADQILPADIQELLNKAQVVRSKTGRDGKTVETRRPVSQQTKQHLLNHVQAVFTFGIEQLKAVHSNPAADVENVIIPVLEPKVLESEQVLLIISHVPDRWRGLFAVAAYTGLRKGELLGLRVKNVHLDRRIIIVAHSYDGPPKSGKIRPVPITEELVPFLRVELGRARSEYLFPGLDGGLQKKACNLPRTMRNAMKAAGLVVGYQHLCRRCDYSERRADDAVGPCPKCKFTLWPQGVPMSFSLKDMRSTCATHSFEATGDIKYVQSLLGHASPKVTERYATLRQPRMLEQGAKLSFGGPLEVVTQSVKSTVSGSTHNGRTVPLSDVERAGTVGDFPQQSQPFGQTRGRGLEPLTSGVTGHTYGLEIDSNVVQAHAITAEGANVRLQPAVAICRVLQNPTHNGRTVDSDRLLTVAETAAALKIHTKTVYVWVSKGLLRAVRFGAVIRIPASEVEGRGGAR